MGQPLHPILGATQITPDPAASDPAAAHAVVTAAGMGTRMRATSNLDAAILCTQAKAALTGLGWKPAIAQAAVSAAVAEYGSGLTLERLIFECLQRCPVPKA